MKAVLHEAQTRGRAQHGWLDGHHTFSFASYYNPERMGFGALRVINDDIVAPSMGFGTHPHQNMEIISIPLKGSLKHKDTMGNETVIRRGEVQAMSAGTGIMHSEYNNSNDADVNFLQIWVLLKKENIEPRYSQKKFEDSELTNNFRLIVSPDGRSNTVTINQDAYFSRALLKKGQELVYKHYDKNNGVYFLNLEGEVLVNEYSLGKRDGLAVEDLSEHKVIAQSDAEVLVMEVPM